jgi:predicted 2-oxoglutarate/Fe(II)-dependent dioxygenase YbiX
MYIFNPQSSSPYLIYEDFIDPSHYFFTFLNSYIPTLPNTSGGVFNLGNTNEPKRISNIKWIHPTNDTKDFYSFLESVIIKANKNSFNYDISYALDDLQYTEYHFNQNGKYDWHQDSGYENNWAYRKLSVTIQISDPSEYEGGDLEIWNSTPYENSIIKTDLKKKEL